MSSDNSVHSIWRPTLCARASGSGDFNLIAAVDEMLEHLERHWGGTVATVAHAASRNEPLEGEQWSTSSVDDSHWRTEIEGKDHSTLMLRGDLWRAYFSSHIYHDVPHRYWLVSVDFRVALDTMNLEDERDNLLSTIDFASTIGDGFLYAKAHPGGSGPKLRPIERGRFRRLPNCFRFLPWITVISSSRLDAASRALLLEAPAHRVVNWKEHVLIELFDLKANPTPLEMDEAQACFVDYLRHHDSPDQGPSPWAVLL